MRKKNFKFYIVLTVLIVSLICSVAGMFAVSANTGTDNKQEFTFSGSVKAQYSVNESVTVPTATIKGQVADYKVVLPDGTYTESEELKLTKSGLYQIEYTAIVGGKVYKKTLSFLVGNQLFTVNGSGSSEFKEIGSSGVYGMYFNLYSGDSITYNGIIDLNNFNSETDSILRLHPYVAKIGEGDISQFVITITDAYDENKVVTIRYEQSIHGNDNCYIDANFNGGKYCGLTNDFAHAPGSYSVDGLNGIKMSYGAPFDESRVDDETYYVQYQRGYVETGKDENGNPVYTQYGTGTYWYYKFTEDYATYKLTADNTKFQRDLEGNKVMSKAALGHNFYGLKIKSIEGNTCYLQTKNYAAFIDSSKYGTAIMGGFMGTGVSGGKNVDQTSAKLWLGFTYDMNTNIVYGRSASGQRLPVADFGNGNIFGETFSGFTDGKVKITITPTVYNKGNCGLFISEIAGEKITEKSSSNFISEYSPVISVNYGEYEKATIPAVKQGETYKLFDATAFDPLEGEVPVITSVYYGYGNLNKIQVNVSDGKFEAKHVGTYTVVYSATNSAGKVTEEILEIESIDDDSKLNMVLTGGKDTASVSAGTPVKAFDSFSFENNYGIVRFSIKAVHKDKKDISFELNEKNKYTFTPVVSGDYQIVYEYSDYSSKITDTVDFTVEKSDIVHYVVNANFPEYFILNGNYNLNFVESYTLNTGVDVKEKTVLSVIDNAGGKVVIDGLLKIKPEYVSEQSTVKIIYSPNKEVSEENLLVREIPVIETGLYTNKLDKSKYLVTVDGDMTFSRTKEGTDCIVNRFDNGKASFKFINNLLANPFTIKFKAMNAGENFKPFDKINVYMFDVRDKDNYVLSSLTRESDGWYVTVNGQGKIKVAASWGGVDDEFSLNYVSEKGLMSINNFYTYEDVKFYGSDVSAKYVKGLEVYVEIFGANGADGVQLISINGEAMNTSSRDLSPAQVDYAHDYNAGEASLNQVVTIGGFAVYDVLTPYLSGEIKVTFTPKDSNLPIVISDVNGKTLEGVDSMGTYQFKLSEYGSYTVEVSVVDEWSYNTKGGMSYTVNVTDYTKPAVDMDTSTRSAKVGDKLILPAYSVAIKDYKCYATIKAPNKYFMGYLDLQNATKETTDDEYFFATTGEYVVTLVVYDSSYNMTEISYKVIVK